jgi:hypothetical protein
VWIVPIAPSVTNLKSAAGCDELLGQDTSHFVFSGLLIPEIRRGCDELQGQDTGIRSHLTGIAELSSEVRICPKGKEPNRFVFVVKIRHLRGR